MHIVLSVVGNLSKIEKVNLLASETNWAWTQAVRDIFQPRGINLMTAKNADEFVDVIEKKPIHATIVDMDTKAGGFVIVRIIRKVNPAVPCIMLSSKGESQTLGKALALGIFSVIDKPVDMTVLQQQLNRLFVKKYNSTIFGI